MRKLFVIISIFISTLTLTTSGQETKTSEKYPWSLSLSFAPKVGFDLFRNIPPHDINESYLLSLDLRADHKVSKKFFYSFGVNFSTNEKHVYHLRFDAASADYFSFGYLIEFPLQINYHFINDSKRINPYLKMAIRNSYYHLNSAGTYGASPYSISTSDYFLLSDLGLGTNFQLNDKFSILVESCIGYGLIYWRPNFGYYEGLLGLRYTF